MLLFSSTSMTSVMSAANQQYPNNEKISLSRASDRSRKKKSNFAGFLGTNSRKNRPISREFWGQTVDFVVILRANFARNRSVLH